MFIGCPKIKTPSTHKESLFPSAMFFPRIFPLLVVLACPSPDHLAPATATTSRRSPRKLPLSSAPRGGVSGRRARHGLEGCADQGIEQPGSEQPAQPGSAPSTLEAHGSETLVEKFDSSTVPPSAFAHATPAQKRHDLQIGWNSRRYHLAGGRFSPIEGRCTVTRF